MSDQIKTETENEAPIGPSLLNGGLGAALRHCPFCGSTAIEVRQGGAWPNGHSYYGKCGECGAEGPSTPVGSSRMKLAAKRLWNSRP